MTKPCGDAPVMTLPDFLLARTTEGEALARAEVARAAGSARRNGKSHALRGARDCEAKRRIVEVLQHPYAHGEPQVREYAAMVLEIMARVWVDHPDYREEWKP